MLLFSCSVEWSSFLFSFVQLGTRLEQRPIVFLDVQGFSGLAFFEEDDPMAYGALSLGGCRCKPMLVLSPTLTLLLHLFSGSPCQASCIGC